jgi:hypothetical protein
LPQIISQVPFRKDKLALTDKIVRNYGDGETHRRSRVTHCGAEDKEFIYQPESKANGDAGVQAITEGIEEPGISAVGHLMQRHAEEGRMSVRGILMLSVGDLMHERLAEEGRRSVGLLMNYFLWARCSCSGMLRREG